MKHRLLVAMVLALALTASGAALAALPKIPDVRLPEQLPDIGKLLEQEPPVTTGLPDALTEVPLLDDFNPRRLSPLSELPRGPDDAFFLVPGVYELVAQSYCLKAGTHAPGRGDGYLYAPLAGREADSVRTILRNSVTHPEIPQGQIQVLLWAIIARAKFEDLSPELQETARTLLTPEQVKNLNRSALDVLPESVRDNAFGRLSPLLRQVAEAENRLRGMLTQTAAPFDELERAAVLVGDAPPAEGSREVAWGRWSYHPAGFFVRYLPHSYSETHVQVYAPVRFQIEADERGRITAVSDEHGNRIETEYDDSVEPLQVPWDSGVRAYAFRSLRFVAPGRSSAGETMSRSWESVGWTLVGTPSALVRSDQLGSRLSDFKNRYGQVVGQDERAQQLFAFTDLMARYQDAVRHREELEGLFKNLREHMGSPPIAEADVADLVDLAHYAVAVREAIAPDAGGQEPWVSDHWCLAYEAWQSLFADLASVGQGAQPAQLWQEPTGGDEEAVAVVLAYNPLAAQGLLPGDLIPYMTLAWGGSPGGSKSGFGGKRRELPWFDPSKQVAVPGNTLRQLLGQSGRSRPSAGKEAMQKAQKVIGWLGYGKTGVDVITDPKGALAGQIGFGIPDRLFGSILDFNFSTWGEVCRSIGGDPPRPDYQAYATAERPAFTPLQAGPSLPAARAIALNSLMEASLDLMSSLRAAQVSYDRFGGAVEANDLTWIPLQAGAYVYFKRQAGEAMVAVADRLDAVLQVVRDEGIQDIAASEEALRAYQERLATQGFSAEEIQAARVLGLTDSELEASRQERLALDAAATAGSLMTTAEETTSGLRVIGDLWTSLPALTPPWEAAVGP
jgi:hypothetical protein